MTPVEYNVSMGRKKLVVDSERLLALSRRGKLSSSCFIRRTDGSDDWSEVATIDWLHVPAAVHGCLRYCVQCDTRIKGSEESLSKTMICPECQNPTQFVDYFDITDDELPGPHVRFSQVPDLLAIATGLMLCVLGLAVAIALFRDPPFSMLLGFFMAVASGGLYCYSMRHRTEAKVYRQHLENVEDVLERRTLMLKIVTNKLTGFERTLNRHLEDVTKAADVRIAAVETKCDKLVAKSELEAHEAKEITGRMAKKYLDEQCKWWTQKLRGDNFHTQHTKVEKAIEFVRNQGYGVPAAMAKSVLKDLELAYGIVVRKEAEKERQRKIREEMRSEQRAEREARDAVEKAKKEQTLIQDAIAEAMSAITSVHSADRAVQEARVEELQRQLKEAEERGQRAIAQAQLTKIGYVYVISNIGSFGEDVFKVGLTRRLEPLDRVKELGDASVPFLFDVHAMIFSEDAPALECALHKALNQFRVNRVNMRKEFFRVKLETIIKVATEKHGEIDYVADAEALDYRSSLELDNEEFELISRIAEEAGTDWESDED